MNEDDTPATGPVPSPHPFASALASALAYDSTLRVLIFGIGNGRNVTPFTQIGFRIDVLEADAARAREAAAHYATDPRVRVATGAYAGPYPFAGGFAGALSTSALLHGTADRVTRSVAAARAALRPDAPFFATFGSTRDPRYGHGVHVARDTFAPREGSEAGVAHAYFDEARLRTAFAGFAIDELTEASAAETAGAWAHPDGDAAAIVHWFVRARRAQ